MLTGGWVSRDSGDGDLWQLAAPSPTPRGCATAEDLVRFAAAHCLGDSRLRTDASTRRMPVQDGSTLRIGGGTGCGSYGEAGRVLG